MATLKQATADIRKKRGLDVEEEQAPAEEAPAEQATTVDASDMTGGEEKPEQEG